MARKHTIIRALDRCIVQAVRCLITLYQYSLSVVIGRQCRFYPSCSHYTAEALQHYGSIRGLCLGLLRILRCGPWHPGGYDPVPLLINQQGNYEHSSNCQLCGCSRTWGAIVDNLDERTSSANTCGKSCGEYCGK